MQMPGDITRVVNDLIGPQTEIGIPQELAVRANDNNWKRFLVYLNDDFMVLTPDDRYYLIENGMIILNNFQFIKGLDTLTIIDPIDGMRWLYENLTWFLLY